MADQYSSNLATGRDYVNTVRFLVWNQFPAILQTSVRYFMSLPQTGQYKQVNPNIIDFKRAILETVSRQFTLSGIGSLIDYERYGNEIKKPTPNYYGTGCNGNTLCLEPTCFGFTEGVLENINQIVNMCWSLAMPCLKDQLYSDMMFDQKLAEYFRMFFAQAPGVLEAYQRTHLIQNAYKIVATNRNYNYTGSVIGTGNISLPFYINPGDPLSFPDLSTITAGVGGANLDAFANFLAPRLFAGSFEGGMKGVNIYGQQVDWEIAKEQTMSVQDQRSDTERVESRLERLMGAGLTVDGLFPTFGTSNNIVYPVTADILQAASIAGYVQTNNPNHSLQALRGLLIVPNNWKYNLVQPPVDDFSYLGVGPGLDFKNNTPGVFPVPLNGGTYLSSSIFRNAEMQNGGTVVLGNQVVNGQVIPTLSGMSRRSRPLAEAVRTRIIMTYAQQTCGSNVAAPAAVVQGEADGFDLKSTMYIGTDVQGSARPVLLLFKTDTPRSALPIEVCDVVDFDIDQEAGLFLSGCCIGTDPSTATLSFTADGLTTAALTELVAATYTDGDTAIYRVGPHGESFTVEITAVSGNMVAIQAVDAAGDPDLDVTLLCCSGVPDDYGFLGELLVVTGTTDACSRIFKATCDELTGVLSIELYNPIVAGSNNDPAYITLPDGTEILVQLTAATNAGVFFTVDAAPGETCVLCDMDCACLFGATFCITDET